MWILILWVLLPISVIWVLWIFRIIRIRRIKRQVKAGRLQIEDLIKKVQAGEPVDAQDYIRLAQKFADMADEISKAL